MITSIDVAHITVVTACARALVAFSAFLFNFIQSKSARKQQRIDNTWNLIHRLHERGDQEDRFRVEEMIAEGSQKGFDKLSPAYQASLSRMSGTFGLIGYLGQRNKIDLEILMRTFGFSIQANHKHLQPYRKYRESLSGYPENNIWKDFDWLAETARAFSAKGRSDNQQRN